MTPHELIESYSVYVHTNKINGMKYVGITSQKYPKERWGKNGLGYHRGQQKFYSAIKEFGWDCFEHDIIYTNLTKEQALEIEENLITKYDSVNNGYNSYSSGKQNYTSDTAKQKLRMQRYGEDNPNYNPNRKHKYRYEKHQTENGIIIKKILNYSFEEGVISTDARKSIEFKQRHRDLMIGENNPNYKKHPWCYGIKMTHAQKQKMFDAWTDKRKKRISEQKQGKNNPQAKKVICITTNTKYDTIVEAAKNTNVSERSVSECCNNKRKSVKGLIFCFDKR